jgi:hypothetical protein
LKLELLFYKQEYGQANESAISCEDKWKNLEACSHKIEIGLQI